MKTTITKFHNAESHAGGGGVSSDAAKDITTTLQLTPLQNSLHLFLCREDEEAYHAVRVKITNEELAGGYIIDILYNENGKYNLQQLHGIDKAYDILQQHPNAKVVVFCPIGRRKDLVEVKKDKTLSAKAAYLQAHENCVFIEIGVPEVTLSQVNNAFKKPKEQALSHDEIAALQTSLNFDGCTGRWDSTMIEAVRSTITNPSLLGTRIVVVDQQKDPYKGLEIAYQQLQQDASKKVILLGRYSQEKLATIQGTTGSMAKFLLAHKNCRYAQLPLCFTDLNVIFDAEQSSSSGTKQEIMHKASEEIARQNLAVIKHSLEPYKVKDPYNPTPQEKHYIDAAFRLTQQYFPGLDTVDKMLDYVLNIKVDIPEVMKGQRIEGVYCDVDGTLLEYVPIGSPLEGTQQLRPEVVKLLQEYEAQGKSITIWTGGNVEEKKNYLMSLGITWPVVSKYDYAGARAEIVVDDTDQAAFVLQSKILAETYIDTRTLQ